MRYFPSIAVVALMLLADIAFAAPLPRFPPNAVWNRDITMAPKNTNSGTMITATGGWGNGNVFQIDQSMHVVHVKVGDPAPPMVPVVAGPNGYTYSANIADAERDCEPLAGLTFPLPAGGAIEGTADYTSCANDSDDCHLFVVLDGPNKLYESYETKLVSGQLQSGCVVIWDLNKVYPPQGRGEQCTSADAAGFPMAPLLFNADEVFAAIPNGDLGHAIRFILPNSKMASIPNPAFTCGSGGRQGLYVHPASHGGCPTGPSSAIPYGSRLRLHSNYNISGYSPAGQAVLRTMKRYGIVLSDGGNIALTAESDMFTTKKWADLGFDENNTYMEQMVAGVLMTDFDVIDTGPQIPLTYECNDRVPDDFIFIDPFDF